VLAPADARDPTPVSSSDRRVVVEAGGSQPPALVADVDRKAAERRHLRPAPADQVVLEGAGTAVVGDRAVLHRDPTA
jgi:hypothetical protein